ncbi:MAG: glutamine synthetase, partial [Nocardioidaceae bacterium]
QRLCEVSGYARRVLEALAEEGVTVEQFHPEYAPGQFELSVAPEDPIAAADTSVLVRETIRGVGQEFGLRTSFSPKVDLSGVGNGGHVHFSLLSGDANLMSGGDGAAGMTPPGESFAAGVHRHLPALMAIGAPSLASYLRLVPSHWAGIYRCWGVENREAAVRVVTGSAGSEGWAANVEVKCFDLLANPYLVLAGIVAAGLDGLAGEDRLPAPVDIDPAAMTDEVRAERGIDQLPRSLAYSVAEFENDDAIAAAFGPGLHGSILAVRRMEMDTYADATDEEIAAAVRWRH